MKTVKQSFTLVEILVVIVIIGILSSFIFFTINDSVEKASIAKSKMFSESIRNNLLLNLVSEWKLDGNTNDSWGNSDGAMNNFSTTPWKTESECVSGTCLNFDGSNDYVSIPISSSFNYGTGDFTWSIWIHPDDFEEYWHTFSVNGDQYEGAFKVSSSTGIIYFHCSSFSTWGQTPNAVVKQSKWNYMVLVRKNNVAYIYLDGKLYNEVPGFNNNFSAHALILGNGHEGEFSDGLMDEAQIYNAAVSETAIKQNYLSGLNNLYAKGLITELEYNSKLSEL
jgi:prepilin-type N-terminal cleavage/methylation domain-containing protein